MVSICCSFLVDMRELTSATTAPSLIAPFMDFSTDPVISGELDFSHPSTVWSDERRASTYAKTISWGMGIDKGKGTNSVICRELYF